MAEKITGRKEELEILEEVRKSNQAEFVAIYGRRRVGKTFLIREFFRNKGIYLEATGIKDASLGKQLGHFIKVFSEVFYKGITLQVPLSWDEAFELLNKEIRTIPRNKKIIIFLDELPWMASRKSKLLQALDFFWNRYWSSQPNLILVVCGSAASWMLHHLILAKGGLYNRLTKRILLEPFNLKETQEFLNSYSIKLSKKSILDLYMIIGGIPFYLKEVRRGKSVTQTIDDLCFKKKGLLYSEFNSVFQSLFDQADVNLKIVREIERAGNSISRDALVAAIGATSGGGINRRLEELEASSFISCFIPYGKKTRDRFYRIIDEYTLFYLKWIEPLVQAGRGATKGGYWQKIAKTAPAITWFGFAFETVCFKHIDQIEKALGLEKIASITGSWRHHPSKKKSEGTGAQIDLLFDRNDGVITLCEIKYSDKLFLIDKSYAKSLDQKIDIFAANFPSKQKPTKKEIFLAMITTFGLKKNMYSETLVQNEVTLDDLLA